MAKAPASPLRSFFVLLLLGYALTMAFSIYFVSTILRRLRSNEQQLVRLGRSLAMSEKLASVGTLAAGDRGGSLAKLQAAQAAIAQ